MYNSALKRVWLSDFSKDITRTFPYWCLSVIRGSRARRFTMRWIYITQISSARRSLGNLQRVNIIARRRLAGYNRHLVIHIANDFIKEGNLLLHLDRVQRRCLKYPKTNKSYLLRLVCNKDLSTEHRKKMPSCTNRAVFRLLRVTLDYFGFA